MHSQLTEPLQSHYFIIVFGPIKICPAVVNEISSQSIKTLKKSVITSCGLLFPPSFETSFLLPACHILECSEGLAQEVISTIGQAFELRFKQYLKNPPKLVTPHDRLVKNQITAVGSMCLSLMRVMGPLICFVHLPRSPTLPEWLRLMAQHGRKRTMRLLRLQMSLTTIISLENSLHLVGWLTWELVLVQHL